MAGDRERARKQFDRIAKAFPNTPSKDPALRSLYEIDHLQPGMPAPDFKISSLGKEEIHLAGLKGKIVLLIFWTHWAPLLADSAPLWVQIHKQLAAGPFAMIGISLDEAKDRAVVEKTVKDLGMTWPQGFDDQGWQSPLKAMYNLKTIPRGFLIDPNGKILMNDVLYRADLRSLVNQEVTKLKKAIQKREAERKKREEEAKKKATPPPQPAQGKK
jgi:peroxiredoxin